MFGSRPGTLSSAVLMIRAARSSGRKSLSDPLFARPMGERAADTMTASGMETPISGGVVRCHPRRWSESVDEALVTPGVWQSQVVTRHVYECPMRWADMDLLGHVNNVVYVDYLQEARVDMLRTHGPAT